VVRAARWRAYVHLLRRRRTRAASLHTARAAARRRLVHRAVDTWRRFAAAQRTYNEKLGRAIDKYRVGTKARCLRTLWRHAEARRVDAVAKTRATESHDARTRARCLRALRRHAAAQKQMRAAAVHHRRYVSSRSRRGFSCIRAHPRTRVQACTTRSRTHTHRASCLLFDHPPVPCVLTVALGSARVSAVAAALGVMRGRSRLMRSVQQWRTHLAAVKVRAGVMLVADRHSDQRLLLAVLDKWRLRCTRRSQKRTR
jgi:hypothetical protein